MSNSGSYREKFLAAQETLTSTERIFSRARMISTTYRNLLDPITVGSLMHVSENLKWHAKMNSDINYDEVANAIVLFINDNENEE